MRELVPVRELVLAPEPALVLVLALELEPELVLAPELAFLRHSRQAAVR